MDPKEFILEKHLTALLKLLYLHAINYKLVAYDFQQIYRTRTHIR